MKEFDLLIQKWNKVKSSLSAIEFQQLQGLFSFEDEMQASSSFRLLYAYGDCALCAILYMKD